MLSLSPAELRFEGVCLNQVIRAHLVIYFSFTTSLGWAPPAHQRYPR